MTVVPGFRGAKVKPIEEVLWRRMEASWTREFGADDEETASEERHDESFQENEFPAEITCASCGASGSSDPESVAFEFRDPWGEHPVRQCAACGTGLFIARGGGGRTEIVPPDD